MPPLNRLLGSGPLQPISMVVPDRLGHSPERVVDGDLGIAYLRAYEPLAMAAVADDVTAKTGHQPSF